MQGKQRDMRCLNTEVRSMMRALSGAHCSDARLYTLQVR